jgi:hypothetical protein
VSLPQLARAEIAKRQVEGRCRLTTLDEAGKIDGDVFEDRVAYPRDSLDPERFREAHDLGIVILIMFNMVGLDPAEGLPHGQNRGLDLFSARDGLW